MSAVAEIADLALKLLVRTDWSGVAPLTIRGREEECAEVLKLC